MNHQSKFSLMRIALSAMFAPIAAAQIAEPGSQAVNINAQAGARAAHAPGLWTQAATARAIAFQDEAFNGTLITEPQPESDLVTELNASIIETAFQNLNAGLLIFEQLLLAELEERRDDTGDGDGGGTIIDPDSLDDFFGDVSGGGDGADSADDATGADMQESDNLDDFFGDVSGSGSEPVLDEELSEPVDLEADAESLDAELLDEEPLDEASLDDEPLDDFLGDISDE